MIQDYVEPQKLAMAATAAAAVGYAWHARNSKPSVPQIEAKYQGGDPYETQKEEATGLLQDLKHLGLKAADRDVHTLMEVAFSKGKPIDDKQMTMEKMIAIIASLPESSGLRKKMTAKVIDGLWASLQHPPLSYLGDKFAYRQADGSHNNPMNPDLGKAGQPYARSVQTKKRLHVVRPDPGLLFDMLMARPDGGFKENPAGISSMLFYHATIIIHDIFRTNRVDPTISDSSSYLDLAPVYGSSIEDQKLIRTFKNGMLKPDTYFEERLLAQPPGVNVMLVLYSRFHNYAADMLLKINEGNRFSLAKNIPQEDALKKQDEDLFQTARLVTGGLYINICLHDYLRGLTNTHHSDSSWTLDPRVDIDKTGPFDKDGVPRGMGNQVSAEFNLLYRFHSTISLRDEAWLNEFFKGLFPDLQKPMSELSVQELLTRLWQYEQAIPKDPSQRTFGGLKRGADGKFSDADLVKILKESMEDPAGNFGARNVPKALRVVEILGILQSRKWGLASLNEMRQFFGLKQHESFEDINSDPDVADILRNLYDHPDMVELYPGLFVEEAKGRMDPGCGGCPPYTVGRAVFSDAVTLVRSDRFYTLDYNTSTLTNWGMSEVQQDYKTLGGSMLYKLIQRGVPGWFHYNSMHVMQPMYTKAMNYEIAKKFDQDWQYTLDDPRPPPRPRFIVKYETIKKILQNQSSFRVPWAKLLNETKKNKKYNPFMLGGDEPSHTAQRNLLGNLIYGPTDFKRLLFDYIIRKANVLLQTDSFNIDRKTQQIDLIRDIAIPVNAHLLGDLLSLDLKTEENPQGSLTTAELYGGLLAFRTWGFYINEPAQSWNNRRRAGEGAEILSKSTESVIKKIAASRANPGIIQKILTAVGWSDPVGGYAPKEGSLRWYGAGVAGELLSSGMSIEETAELLWLTAVAGVGTSITTFAEVMVYFLDESRTSLWDELQKLAAKDSAEADRMIRRYIVEAQRLTNSQMDSRFVVKEETVDGQTFKPGEILVLSLGDGARDEDSFPEAKKFRTDRDEKHNMQFGWGPHQCLGREIATLFVTALVKVCASLKNLRTAPGEMGLLRRIQTSTGRYYLTDDWAYLTNDPTTWKLHYDGYGRGVGHHDPGQTGGKTLSIVYDELKQKAKEAHESKESFKQHISSFTNHMSSSSSSSMGVSIIEHVSEHVEEITKHVTDHFN